MAVKANASAAAETWAQNFGASGTKYAAGINSVTVAPGQLAAAQKNAYLSGVQQNANIWAANVAKVDLGTWKAAATGVGAQRLATGATKGQAKMQAFMQNFIPQLDSIVSGLPARGSFDQNIARFTTFAQQLHAKKGSFR